MRKLHRLLSNTWAIVYNFLVCYFIDRPRRVAFTNSVLSFHHRQRLASLFPSVELTDVVPELKVLDLHFEEFSYRGGNVSFGELCTIGGLVRFLRPKKVFEFGTNDGNTTLQLALNSPDECVVYTLDLPPGSARTQLRLEPGDLLFVGGVAPGARFARSSVANKICQIQSDSATYEYSGLRRSVDLVFVDGSHSFAYIENDTNRALEMLAQGGIILWHDYMVWNDVTDYLNDLAQRLPLRHIKGTSLVVYSAGQK